MAKIVSYESPLADQGLRVSDKGIGALESEAAGALSSARSIAASRKAEGAEYGGAINAVGEVAAQGYQQFIVQPELSKGAALASGLADSFTNQWNALAAKSDPNDASIKQKFFDEVVTPQLNQFKEGFNTADGKKYADLEANRLNSHLLEKTTADMGTRAGEALKVNVVRTTNNLTNMVRADPSSFQHALDMGTTSISALAKSSPFLSADMAAKVEGSLTQSMKAELAKAAILGTAERSPKDAQALIDSGKFNDLIDGNEMSAMVKQMTRAQRYDAAFAKSQKDEAAKELSVQNRDEYIKNIFSPGAKAESQGLMQRALTDPTLLPADREHIANMIAGKLKPETDARKSAINTQRLYSQIISNDPSQRITDIGPITKAFAEGDITRTDLDWLMKTFTEARSPEGIKLNTRRSDFLDGARKLITASNPIMNKIDPSGDQQAYKFQRFVDDQIDAARKAGRNVDDLFNPNSPAYLGKPEVLAPYQKTLTDSLTDQAIRMQRSAGASVVDRRTPEEKINGPSSNFGGTITGFSVENRPPISGAPTPPAGYPTAQLAPDGKTWIVETSPGVWQTLRKKEKK